MDFVRTPRTSFDHFHKKMVEEVELIEKKLQEATKEEMATIKYAVEQLGPEDLAFDGIFKGKKRLVIDFSVIDSSTEFGKFVELWEKMGYTVDWSKAMLSATKPYKDISPEGISLDLFGLPGGSSSKDRKINMKIGKWLNKVNRLAKKIRVAEDQIITFFANRRTVRQAGIATTAAAILKDKEALDKLNNYFPRPRGHRVVIQTAQESWLKNRRAFFLLLTGDRLKHAFDRRLNRTELKYDLKAYYRLISDIDWLAGEQGDVMAGNLSRSFRNPEHTDKLLKFWQENAAFAKKMAADSLTDKYAVIITRDPRDIFRMSDFEKIQSCHSPPSRGGDSTEYKCVIAEAHGHGAMAYVVLREDLLSFVNRGRSAGESGFVSSLEEAEREIQSGEIFGDDTRYENEGDIIPIARMRIRQMRYFKDRNDFENARSGGQSAFTPADQKVDYGGTELAVPEEEIYPHGSVPGLKTRVVKWARDNQGAQLKTVPKNSNFPMTKHGEEPWQFGSTNASLFIIYGGSYEDTTRKALLKNLMGAEMPIAGKPFQDVATEKVVEHDIMGSLRLAYQRECDEITDSYLTRLKSSTVGATAKLDANYATYIQAGASLHISWEEEDWITWPDLETISYAIESLEDYGFDWAESDYPNNFKRIKTGNVENPYGKQDKRTLEISIIPAKDRPTRIAGGATISIDTIILGDPHEYEEFCNFVAEDVDARRDAVKLLLTNFFKREGAIVGGELMTLAGGVENSEIVFEAWEGEVEEGRELDEYESITFIAEPVVDYKKYNLSPQEVYKALADNSEQFLTLIYGLMTAGSPEWEEQGYMPEICLDCEPLKTFDEQNGIVTLDIRYSVYDGDPDQTVRNLKTLITSWDDQDRLDNIASNALLQLLTNSRKESKLAESYGDIDDLGSIIKTNKILSQLNEIIRKTGTEYCLYSKKKGKNGKRKKLGCYSSRAKAKKRERQIQYFKHMSEEKEEQK